LQYFSEENEKNQKKIFKLIHDIQNPITSIKISLDDVSKKNSEKNSVNHQDISVDT